MANKKRPSARIFNIARGPIKLRPTQAHKNKKAYNRKEGKTKLKSLIKTAPN